MSIRYSVRQLLRTPLKLLLFLLIVAASTALLIFGANLWLETGRQLRALEERFTTIGTVQQREDSLRVYSLWDAASKSYTNLDFPVYNAVIPPSVLKVEGLTYLAGPEKRPYYGALMQKYETSADEYIDSIGGYRFVAEFTPDEDCVPSEPVHVKIVNVLSGDPQGDKFWFCDQLNDNPKPMEAGKTYIAYLFGTENRFAEARAGTTIMFYPLGYPLSSQHEKDGTRMVSVLNEDENYLAGNQWEEVTDGFYETGRGRYWLNLIASEQIRKKNIPVLPTESLALLPAFHKGEAAVKRGREISAEEFGQGAAVCLVTEEFAQRNELQVGDKLTLPLLFADYCSSPGYSYGYCGGVHNFSLLNAQGELYSPFWELEYKIVGTYRFTGDQVAMDMTSEMGQDEVIIPAGSVKASDEHNIVDYGPMQTGTTSFQIPNGSIAQFETKFRTLPEANFLEIRYDDNGYEQISGNLKNARSVAMLLSGVGLLAALSSLVFLLYFFVVRQKKRTAVERSLGMTKAQCRLSLLSGVVAMTLLGVILGSAGSGAVGGLLSQRAVQPELEYSLKYSNWTRETPELGPGEAGTDHALPLPGILIPALLVLFTSGLALALVDQNLKAEPIELLSTRED